MHRPPLYTPGAECNASNVLPTLPDCSNILPAYEKALHEDPFWGAGHYSSILPRAQRLTAGIQHLIAQCEIVESLVSSAPPSPTSGGPNLRRGDTIGAIIPDNEQRNREIKLKKGRVARRQTRLRDEGQQMIMRMAWHGMAMLECSRYASRPKVSLEGCKQGGRGRWQAKDIDKSMKTGPRVIPRPPHGQVDQMVPGTTQCTIRPDDTGHSTCTIRPDRTWHYTVVRLDQRILGTPQCTVRPDLHGHGLALLSSLINIVMLIVTPGLHLARAHSEAHDMLLRLRSQFSLELRSQFTRGADMHIVKKTWTLGTPSNLRLGQITYSKHLADQHNKRAATCTNNFRARHY
ncbi:hypothetical protein E2P81_ATG01442 [Venturia nashicola]|uniref:Uncharacterized protein n=1 Tax=Venturia nashicola TaxID=86259 RepID=A0A4Z1PEX7_9PEZI|nr:hypothetical protein E6O75_ATG01476 [Venturia nashicola]TLD38899.1 hypothetical protein E2P81_ATG01442 [Venturia nashicola]